MALVWCNIVIKSSNDGLENMLTELAGNKLLKSASQRILGHSGKCK